MKKYLFFLLCVLLFTGCEDAQLETGENSMVDIENNQINSDDKSKAAAEPPVLIEELPMEMHLLDPQPDGRIYLEGTYTNNSDQIVDRFSIEMLDPSTNERILASEHGTVLPGEVSITFGGGPVKGSLEELENLKLSYQVIHDNKSTRIEYDYKIGEYSFDTYDEEAYPTPEVEFEDLPYGFEQPPNPIPNYWNCSYTNNSKMTIKSFNLTMHNTQTNRESVAASPDTVLAGETSPNILFDGSESLEDLIPLSLKYSYNADDGKEVLVEYNYKTKKYIVDRY